jgi:hypothetical protein
MKALKGNSDRAPNMDEVLDLLKQPGQNLIINLLGVKLEDRPSYLVKLLPSLLELRAQTGRPHWIVIDEAHHLLPTSWDSASGTLPQTLDGLMLITVHPNHVAIPALSLIDTLVAVGKEPTQTLESFCQAVGYCPPQTQLEELEPGIAVAWFRKTEEAPFLFQIQPPQSERYRHRRKYAEGQLGTDKSFYFRGPEQKLNLRAQNLITFTQLAEGVDRETWLYHLQQQDYSRWFREAIKDDTLAEEAAQIESTPDLSAEESRDRIKAVIEQRYTLPA